MFHGKKWKNAGKETEQYSKRLYGKLSESWDNPTQIKMVQWTVSNFASLSLVKHLSPSFTFKNTLFHFELLFRKYLSVCCSEKDPFPHPMQYSFGIETSDEYLIGITVFTSTIGKTMAENFKFDVEEALRRHRMVVRPSDSLTIVCHLQLAPETTKKNRLSEESTTVPLDNLQLAETDVLSKNLRELFINKVSTDTVLQVKRKKFNVHKAILIARSSVFAAMFQHDTSEKQTGIVKISDCDSDSFQEFLEYMYCGKLEGISVNKAIHLYRTSDKYDVQELKTFCTKYVTQNLTAQNVCDVVMLADQYDDTKLFSVAQDFFNKKLKEILVTTEWANLMKLNNYLANKLLIQMSNSKERL